MGPAWFTPTLPLENRPRVRNRADQFRLLVRAEQPRLPQLAVHREHDLSADAGYRLHVDRRLVLTLAERPDALRAADRHRRASLDPISNEPPAHRLHPAESVGFHRCPGQCLNDPAVSTT